jgi:hypothetical protein
MCRRRRWGARFRHSPAENEPQADTLTLDDRQRFLGVVLEARLRVLVGLGQRDPGLNPIPAVRSFARLGGVRSECVIPRPATIQLTSPGRMIWFDPTLSRC